MKLHKMRTHVQLRRRNNPEYFAMQKASSGGGKISAAAKKIHAESSVEDNHRRYAVDVTDEAVENLMESVFVKEETCQEVNVDEMVF